MYACIHGGTEGTFRMLVMDECSMYMYTVCIDACRVCKYAYSYIWCTCIRSHTYAVSSHTHVLFIHTQMYVRRRVYKHARMYVCSNSPFAAETIMGACSMCIQHMHIYECTNTYTCIQGVYVLVYMYV